MKPALVRSSDLRKLKQTIAERFSLQPDVLDSLIPDGLLYTKVNTDLRKDRGVSKLMCYHDLVAKLAVVRFVTSRPSAIHYGLTLERTSKIRSPHVTDPFSC